MKICDKCYFLFYFILNFLSPILIIVFELLSNKFLSQKFLIVQLFSSLLSLIMLIITRNKPGYLEKDKIQEEDFQKKTLSPSVETAHFNFESTPIVHYNLMQSNGCTACNIAKLPLRSHHCEKCERCVKSFDHHCWILAGCVGENNKAEFIIYLFFQTFSLVFSSIGITKIMSRRINEGTLYILTFVFSILCLLGIIFFWIFIFHLYTLFTNQTSFELFNNDQCPYLALFSLERNKILTQRGIILNNNFRYRPFDVGFKRNIKLFFDKMIHKKNIIKWEEIFFENLKTNHISLNC